MKINQEQRNMLLANKVILDQKHDQDSNIWVMYTRLLLKSLKRKLIKSEYDKIESALQNEDFDYFLKMCDEKLNEKDYEIINSYLNLKLSKLFN